MGAPSRTLSRLLATVPLDTTPCREPEPITRKRINRLECRTQLYTAPWEGALPVNCLVSLWKTDSLVLLVTYWSQYTYAAA